MSILPTLCRVALALPVLALPTGAGAQILTAGAAANPAVQVFAMGTFVEQNCIGLRINKANGREAFVRSGGYEGWGDHPFHQTMVREQVETLRGDVPRNCAKLWNLYGKAGAIQPGIIEAEAIVPPTVSIWPPAK